MKDLKDCCKSKKGDKKCKRKTDKKVFSLPRKYSKKYCLGNKKKGFTQRSSCAPYKGCKKVQKGGKKKMQFLYNPDDPKKSFDVYIDKDPSDTIPIKYTTYDDVKRTIRKLERLYKSKKYTHKRIFQVAMILYVRLKVLKKKKPEHFKLSKRYFEFVKTRTKSKTFTERKRLTFKF